MNRTGLVLIAGLFVSVPLLGAACGGGDRAADATLPPIVTTTTTTIVLTTTTFVETFYEVQSGDTLSKIARSFGVSLGALMAANGITNPDLVQAGQTLQIPPSTVLVDSLPDAPVTTVAPTGLPPTTTTVVATTVP